MNPFNLKDIFKRAALIASERSPTAGVNKYMPHDGARKAERERRNCFIKRAYSRTDAAASRRAAAEASRASKGIRESVRDEVSPKIPFSPHPFSKSLEDQIAEDTTNYGRGVKNITDPFASFKNL